ncbi:hypothetical protein ACJX0J_023476, partial [Zea mays]
DILSDTLIDDTNCLYPGVALPGRLGPTELHHHVNMIWLKVKKWMEFALWQ